jgi:hypothetical protein
MNRRPTIRCPSGTAIYLTTRPASLRHETNLKPEYRLSDVPRGREAGEKSLDILYGITVVS